MRPPRIGFLTAFFTLLGVCFVAAVVWRAVSFSPSPDRMAVPAASARGTTAESQKEAGKHASQNQADTAGAETVTEASADAVRRAAVVSQTSAATASPAAADATPSAAPSLLSRIVAPIVNALGRGDLKPAAAQTSSTQAVENAGAATSSHGGGSQADRTTTAKDLSSDTQPPQLLAISFTPPQVEDGEQTALTVQATDDLSGVRSISGTVRGPSGAAQGFACQRQGDSDIYVAHITVPKEAADGIWAVNFLNMVDFASNALTLSAAQLPTSASFRVVSSAPDTQGPTLRGIWLEKPAIRAGERDTVFIQADDDKSGVSVVSGSFLSPSKIARVGFVCRPAADGPWTCDFVPPDCADCGDWRVEQIQMQDKANNRTVARTDNPLVASAAVNVIGDKCDNAAPVLQGVTLDRNAVSNIEENMITVTAIATDDSCGLMSMNGQATGPGTGPSAPHLYFSFTPTADPQTWTGRIIVPKLAAKGVWRITWLQVLDRGHNPKMYNANDPMLATAVFTVR